MKRRCRSRVGQRSDRGADRERTLGANDVLEPPGVRERSSLRDLFHVLCRWSVIRQPARRSTTIAPMAKKRNDSAISKELDDVLARAQDLYPRLVTRRAELAAELARIDAALERLGTLGRSPRSERKDQPKTRRTPRRRSSAKTTTAKRLEQPVLAALGRLKQPVGSAAILKALRAKGIAAAMSSLQIALRRLRDQGHVRTTGKAKRFQYELAARSVGRDTKKE
jgi:hypothetical protein